MAEETLSSDKPTLLSACDRLSPDTMVTVVPFTRFILPTVKKEGSGLDRTHLPAVLPRTLVDPTLARTFAMRSTETTWLQAQGGISPVREWNADNLQDPVAMSVSVGDVDALIATRQVTVGEQQLELSLDPGDIDALLAGSPAVACVVRGGDRPTTMKYVRLTPKSWPQPVTPGPVVIRDLLRFLAAPALPPGPGGEPGVPVDLSAESVRALRIDRRATVTVSDRTLEFVVDETRVEGSDPEPGPITAWTGEQASSRGGGDRTAAGESTPLALELALALTWHQRWQLLGYTRGELLNTVTLAPQEETTIEVFSWDRRRNEADRSSTVEVDNSLDRSDTTRDTTDVLTETKNSSNFNWNVQGGLTFPATSALPLTLGGGAASQKTWEGLARTTTNHISESIERSATKVRLSRQSKIIESSEYGWEQRITRSVKNPNMCRTLNLDYFEVLARYDVTTSFAADQTRLCVLVPSPFTPSFVRATVRRFETPLRRALLDRTLDPGFDAARMLDARSKFCSAACERCTCGGATVVDDPATISPYVLSAVRDAAGAWRVLKESPLVPTLTGTEEARYRLIVTSVMRWAYAKALLSAAPGLVMQIDNALARAVNKYELTRADADAIWWALRNAGGIEALRPAKLWAERKADIELAVRYQENTGIDPSFVPSSPTWDLINTGALDDFSLVTHLDRFATAYSGLPAAQAVQTASAPPTAPTPADLATEAMRDAYPVADVTRALEREEALLAHLSDNASYYWMALWHAVSPSQQAASLTNLLPPGIVEPWPIGMVGTRLAFPISPYTTGVSGMLDDLFPTPEETDPPPTPSTTISLPTTAITSEARLGACDGCEEFIRKTRTNDLRMTAAKAAHEEAKVAVRQAEADRRRALINAKPPQLQDPAEHRTPPLIRVQLQNMPPFE